MKTEHGRLNVGNEQKCAKFASELDAARINRRPWASIMMPGIGDLAGLELASASDGRVTWTMGDGRWIGRLVHQGRVAFGVSQMLGTLDVRARRVSQSPLMSCPQAIIFGRKIAKHEIGHLLMCR